MSNDVKRKPDPFNGPLTRQRPTESVGLTIGARRNAAKAISSQPAPVTKQPVDKFSNKKVAQENLGNFVSNATYRKSRAIRPESPYSPPRLAAVERGLIPKTDVEIITDEHRDTFLQHIINTPELHTARSIRNNALAKIRAARPMGNPKVPLANPKVPLASAQTAKKIATKPQ